MNVMQKKCEFQFQCTTSPFEGTKISLTKFDGKAPIWLFFLPIHHPSSICQTEQKIQQNIYIKFNLDKHFPDTFSHLMGVFIQYAVYNGYTLCHRERERFLGLTIPLTLTRMMIPLLLTESTSYCYTKPHKTLMNEVSRNVQNRSPL